MPEMYKPIETKLYRAHHLTLVNAYRRIPSSEKRSQQVNVLLGFEKVNIVFCAFSRTNVFYQQRPPRSTAAYSIFKAQ